MSRLRGSSFRRWSWLCILALVLVALIRAGASDGAPSSTEERVRSIAATIKCPTCRSQSVAGSDSAAARAIRVEIDKRVRGGESADEIRTAIAATYGDDVLLTPSRSGAAGLVWVLPVVALVLASAGLLAAFARWRRGSSVPLTDADRALVDRALTEHGEHGEHAKQ